MKLVPDVLLLALLLGASAVTQLRAQNADQGASASQSPASPKAQTTSDQQYSGMYTFLKEGEFVQITVEDGARVTGFISRYGDGESDKGAFLDQFFKTGKLEGNVLSFSTEIVHGVSFDFNGSIERGEGKKPGDEAYYLLKGTLTEKSTDVNKKVTAHQRDVVFKMFPQDAQ
ncbi:MAG TPA: hypothetical protein VKQ11_04870 [Candidatus Sulfotelmatobacter sp.]|nr:hypothetical protein [Candidatus Sulfotelmatobacter sp.]